MPGGPEFRRRFQQNNKNSRDKRPRDKEFAGKKGKQKRIDLLSAVNSIEEIEAEITSLKSRYEQITPPQIKKFPDFPLSKRTLTGLTNAKYTVPTDIQKETIGLGLQGHDVLAAAKTGSGKTLAFLIPILECLYCQKWSAMDGLGALVISPTRELAYQIFAVLRRIGKQHDFSAGLVVGGMNLKTESKQINYTNIIICTPGRLLQHMDETHNFSAHSLQVLVLDEADRILDLGFSETMNAIIENLPTSRQTLLFSATQTKSVKDLARLSLNNKNLFYVSIDEFADQSTPSQLVQSYITCELEEKMTVLWSFLKNHLKKKILVFLTTCSEVRYIFKALCHMRPGISLHALYGKMKQHKRMEVFQQFCFKQHAVLFATDVASRGLDIPQVNWVIQYNCPEDANTYIHRVGRTARYKQNGESLLFLLPSEETAMLEDLQRKKIPVKKIQVNPKMLWDIRPRLQSQCAADPTMKENAKKAFVTYVRSVFLMSNKKIFDVDKLDLEEFARSLGLEITPRIRFLEREQQRLLKKTTEKSKKKTTSAVKTSDSDEEEDSAVQGELLGKLSTLKKGCTQKEASSSDEEDNDDELNQKLKKTRARANARSKANNSSCSESDNNEADVDSGDGAGVNSGDGAGVNSGDGAGSSSDEAGSSSDETGDSSDEAGDSSDNENSSSDEDDGDGPAKIGMGHDNDEDNDDNDDLLTLKRRIPAEPADNLDTEVINDEKISNKKKNKVLTKIALAKRALKKNVQLNTKVVFDDEGDQVQDFYKDPQTAKQDTNVGGINIEEAKNYMETEDKFDKKFFQDKIKQQHREKRLKVKETMLAKKMQGIEDQPIAVLGSAKKEESSSSSEGNQSAASEYSEKEESSNAQSQDDSNSHSHSNDSSDSTPPKKRSRMDKVSSKSKSEENSDDDDDDDSSEEDSEKAGISITAKENLVLKLLHS